MQFMIGYDPLGALFLHSKVRLAEYLVMSTLTYCSFNILLLAITVFFARQDAHTGWGK